MAGAVAFLDEALALHAALIARHGGRQGVRDMGLVEGALARARSGYYESLSEQAAQRSTCRP